MSGYGCGCGTRCGHDGASGHAASGGASAFVDPESGLGRWGGAGERSGLQQYERSLEAFLERWSGLAAAHGMSHRVWSTSEAFESFLPDLLR